MPTDEEAVLAAAEAIADARPFDWAALESQLGVEDRALLDQMRVIASVAHVHRRHSKSIHTDLRRATAVSDGEISWQELESELRSLTNSAFRKEFQLIAGVATFHRR